MNSEFQNIIAVLSTQDLKNSSPTELFEAVTKQLKLKRDDWIEVLLSLNKSYPVAVYDPTKRKKVRVKTKDKYLRYLKKLKSEHFKIYAVSFVYNLYMELMGPIAGLGEINEKGEKSENQTVE